ncbi:hypothetical protein [Schwartzia sp. (in: firmicutes)]
MNYIEEINEKGTACLMTENELNMLRMTGNVGLKLKNAHKAAQAARDELMLVFRASGYSVDQLERMKDENGEHILCYGIADIIRQEL